MANYRIFDKLLYLNYYYEAVGYEAVGYEAVGHAVGHANPKVMNY